MDSWALGCTLFCLSFGRSPFESPKEGVLRLAILNGKYSLPISSSTSSTPTVQSSVGLQQDQDRRTRRIVTSSAKKSNGNNSRVRGVCLSSRSEELLRRMLLVDHSERPFMPEIVQTCEDILQHSNV